MWQSGSRWSFLEKSFWIEPTSMWWLNTLRTRLISRWWWIYYEIRARTFNLRRSMCLKWVPPPFFLVEREYSVLKVPPLSRCSSQIPKNHHKLRLFYGETRKSCWIFWKLSTMTKRVRMLISHFWPWIYHHHHPSTFSFPYYLFVFFFKKNKRQLMNFTRRWTIQWREAVLDRADSKFIMGKIEWAV